jgi:Tfp pilus assembly protein PilN
MEAFMIGIPRYIADTMLNAIGQAGFKPSLMDIKPMALARLARVPTAVIIDVQPDEFDIVVMVNGLPQPVRTLPFPEENISFEERMEIVRDELERTVQFHNSNNVENLLDSDTPLLVSGELADEPAAYESLAESVGFKVSLLASPLKCPKHLDPSHHLVNVGLALKQLTKDAGPLLPNFNTLPAHYQPKQLSLNRIIAIPMTAAAGALIIVLAMTVQNASANLEAVKSQLDANNIILVKRQAEKKDLADNIASLEKQIKSMESQRQGFSVILNDLTNNGNLMNSDITASVDNVIADLDLSGLSHSGHLLSLKGLAASEQEVMEYVRKLTATGRFSEVTISNISLQKADSESGANVVGFSLSLKLGEAQK